MSILIKGVDMPSVDSDVIVRIWGTGYIQRIESYHSYEVPYGKAIELPPHGDLVDRNALLQRAIPHGWSTPKWVSDIVINDAPTIVEAEGERW